MAKFRIFVLFVAFSISKHVDAACSGLENRLTCNCFAKYSFKNQTESNLLLPFKSYDDCGIGLGCERLLSCQSFCLDQLKQILGFYDSLIRNSVCNLASKSQSISENGLTLWFSYKYGNKCNDPVLSYQKVLDDICCNPRCTCKINGQNMQTNRMEELVNFSPELPKKENGYPCQQIEIKTCETDCLGLVSNRLQSSDLNPNSGADMSMMASYNIFKTSQPISTQPIAQLEVPTYAAEFICKNTSRVFNKPGLDLFIKIATDEKLFKDGVGKYVPIGRICCKQICHCELFAQNAERVDQNSFEKSELVEDYTTVIESDANYSSYTCEDELTNCMIMCRKAMGKSLQSNLLQTNQTVSTLVASNLNVFNENTPGLLICQRLKKKVNPPGIHLYLRYYTNKATFPFVEEMHVGTVCCYPYPNGLFLPFNRCYDYPA